MSKRKEAEIEQQPTGELIVSTMEDVMHNSMLPYAEYVILDRALPRVEDGLKPVQRRILYTMNEMGLTPDKPHKKCARIVGDCMGKYHPHGDSSVYDALVRLAQEFNMGQTLVDGHGNFGSVDGDGAAAMRYTEARMTSLALEMLRDLDKETVPWEPNFDDSLKEPSLLPARFPNLLVNGAYGIAVGLATNIPTHNLAETIDGVVALIDNPKITLEEMMKYIPAPDFSTGGYIIANELKQAYATGKGRITLRAKVHVEPDGEKKLIVIDEIPYQVNKANTLRKIAEMRNEKKDAVLENVLDILDESDRTGMRAVIKLRPETDIDAFLKFLWKNTDLQVSFGINIVAIADGKPQQLGLMDILRYYLEYQRNVVLRRTKFDLAQAKERCHILEGLIIAVRNIDEVVQIIKTAESTSDARTKLRDRFELSERQAQAILDLRLARLTKLEVFKLEQELAELKKRIEKLTKIVNSKQAQLEVVKEEITEIRKKYGKPRRCEVVQSEEDIVMIRKDLKPPPAPCKICIMADGLLKCVSEKNFNLSSKEVTAKTRKGNLVSYRLDSMTDKTALVFTNLGNAHKIDPDDISCKLSEKGFNLSDVAEDAQEDERPIAVFAEGDERIGDLLFITEKGMLKRTAWSEYNLNKKSYQAIRLNDGDRVTAIEPWIQDEGETIFFVTKNGICLNTQMDDIPVQGRIAGGVKGIMLGGGDKVIFAKQTNGEGEIVVVTKAGYAKRVICCMIDPSPRYRKGGKIITFADKTDEVLYADYVTEPYYIAVEDEEGFDSLETEDISIDSNTAKGKKLGKKGIKSIVSLKNL